MNANARKYERRLFWQGLQFIRNPLLDRLFGFHAKRGLIRGASFGGAASGGLDIADLFEDGGVLRIGGGGGAEFSQGGFGIATLVEEAGQGEVSGEVIRFERQDLTILIDRAGGVAGGRKRLGEAEAGRKIIGRLTEVLSPQVDGFDLPI